MLNFKKIAWLLAFAIIAAGAAELNSLKNEETAHLQFRFPDGTEHPEQRELQELCASGVSPQKMR